MELVCKKRNTVEEVSRAFDCISRVSSTCNKLFVLACRGYLRGRLNNVDGCSGKKSFVRGKINVNACATTKKLEQSVSEIDEQQKDAMNARNDVFTSDQCMLQPQGIVSDTKRRRKAKMMTLNKEWLLAGRTEESADKLSYVYNINGLDENWVRAGVDDSVSAEGQYVYNVRSEKESVIDIGNSFGMEHMEECKQLIEDAYINGKRPTVFPEAPAMHIRVTSEVPIAMAPRRLSHHDKEKVKGIIADFLEQGIIRQSSSEYAAPIVLVKKKSGDTKMCCDYRSINSITAKQNWPLPLIDDCLSGKDCMTLMDLKNGFHQMRVSDESIKYTAFVTPNGQYEWLRVPFGLKNGPSAFQFFINHIFRDMICSV